MRTYLAAVFFAGVAACTSLSPTEDPVYLKLTDLEARLIRIERVVDNESLMQLATELDQIESETQLLRGDVETMRFESQGAAERQQALYLDLDTRLQSLESNQSAAFEQARQAEQSRFAASNDSPAAAAPPPRPLGSDQDNYNAAFDMIQARRYPEAAAAFSGFLGSFPESPLADNAQYWLAETYYVQREFEQALPEFEKVIDEYPQSAKLADALLKIGYCNFELQRWSEARTALEQVSRQFPGTTAARLAVQRLERLAQETG